MNLQRAILLVLSASPRAIPNTVIQVHLPQFIGGEHTLDDIDLALRDLNRKGHAKGTANEDRGTLWKETDDGRLRI